MLQSEGEKLVTGAGKGQELDLGSEIREAFPEEAGMQHTGSNGGWTGGKGPSASALLILHFSLVFTERLGTSNSFFRKQMSGSFIFPF